jgi:hypothetical protein
MKKTLLSATFCFFLIAVFGQKTDIQLAFNSGLFSFAGTSPTKTTFINKRTFFTHPEPANDKQAYTNNPYGAIPEICYGLAASVRRVSKKNLLFGFEMSYEVLRSRVNIDRVVDPISSSFAGNMPATGKTNLNFTFLNAYPHIGYRFQTAQFHFDWIVGFDAAFGINAQERGKATAENGNTYVLKNEKSHPKFDPRLRSQIAISFNEKIDLYIGYSYGFWNYKSEFVGITDDNAFARMIRFGVAYRLK